MIAETQKTDRDLEFNRLGAYKLQQHYKEISDLTFGSNRTQQRSLKQQRSFFYLLLQNRRNLFYNEEALYYLLQNTGTVFHPKFLLYYIFETLTSNHYYTASCSAMRPVKVSCLLLGSVSEHIFPLRLYAT